MFEISKEQTKYFVLLILILLLVFGGLLGYYYSLNKALPGQPGPTPRGSGMVDTGRIDTCVAQQGQDPLVENSPEVAPGILELDFRGKVAQPVSVGTATTGLRLTSLDGMQTYDFQIENSEPVYGKNRKLTLSDLKTLDELLIAINCQKGQRGTFKVSKIYKVEK